jgi:CTP:phosphocholine cytidylyltransferase-like protein
MNAIILAAGLGSRFGEITKNTHKSLLPVGGKPNIERTIEYLIDFGIQDITIITGYLSDSFGYLSSKYPKIKFINNEHYRDYNNLYTFSLALDHFSDTYVIDADVVLLENIFAQHDTSVYYTLLREQSDSKEWIPVVDEEGVVQRMEVSSSHQPSMLGISYWSRQDAKTITQHYQSYMAEGILSDPKMYWDNIPVDCLDKLTVKTYVVDESLVDEMDTVENYEQIKRKYEKKQTNVVESL